MAKRLVPLILILLLIGVAIFGVMGMNLHMAGNGSLCPLSFPNKSDCSTNGILSAIHHLSAYKIFSYASPAFISVLLILLITAISVLISRFAPHLILEPYFQRSDIKKAREGTPLCIRRLKKWLSLFELSPSI